MMCYRDQTFCNFHKDCDRSKTCSRALTKEVLAGAKIWWKGCDGEPPICLFVEKPDCWKEEK